MHFSNGFLVAFPKKEKQKPTLKANPPKKQTKPTPASDISEPSSPYKLLEIGTKSICAIKYNLLDGFQYQVDVCSWGQPGKVYASGDSRAVRCLQTEKLTVVCFSIYHAFTQLKFEQDDIIKLLNQSVSFKFFDSKTQMSARAQSDAPKYFYDDNETNDKASFAIIYESKTSDGPDNTINEEKVTFETLSHEAQSINAKVISKLRGKPLGLHKKKLLDMIGSLDDKIAREMSLLSQSGPNKSGRSTGKSQGKQTAKTAQMSDNTITFSCTELLLDEIMIQHQKTKPAKEIEFVAVIVSAKDIMLKEMRESLFPFSVEIKRLKYLPPANLSLTHIFLKYSLEGAFTQETEKIGITQDNYQSIEFDYSKVLFINRMDFPFSVFIEALQTGLFFIEFYGVPAAETDKEDTNTPKKVEDSEKNSTKLPKPKRKNLSKKGSKDDETKPNILLAVAYMNLCDMLESKLWTDYNIHLTSNLPYESWWSQRMYQDETILQEERKDKPEKVTPHFAQKDLIECGTIIKVRLRNGDLIQPAILPNILSQRRILSRIIIVFDANDMSDVIWEIININKSSGGKDNVIQRKTFDSLMSFQNDFSSISSDEVEMNYISGFLIDTLDKKFLMAEGLSNFKFSKILGSISRLKYNENVKIFFNSSFVFTERLYPESNQRYIIKLKKTLSSTMRLPYNVLKQKLSLLSLKAVMKLNSILKCYTMQELCVQKLFPSPKEMSALVSELGK